MGAIRGRTASGAYDGLLASPDAKPSPEKISQGTVYSTVALSHEKGASIGRLIRIYGGAMAWDKVTTMIAVRRLGEYGREANVFPGMQSDIGRFGIGALQTAALVLVDKQIQKTSPRTARWFRGSVVSIYAGIGVWNLTISL